MLLTGGNYRVDASPLLPLHAYGLRCKYCLICKICPYAKNDADIVGADLPIQGFIKGANPPKFQITLSSISCDKQVELSRYFSMKNMTLESFSWGGVPQAP